MARKTRRFSSAIGRIAYGLETTTKTKAEANKVAKRLRDRGFGVRITKEKSGYSVWTTKY